MGHLYYPVQHDEGSGRITEDKASKIWKLEYGATICEIQSCRYNMVIVHTTSIKVLVIICSKYT